MCVHLECPLPQIGVFTGTVNEDLPTQLDGPREEVKGGPGWGAEPRCPSAAFGQKAEGRAEPAPSVSRRRAQPYPSDTHCPYCVASLAPGRPRRATMFWKGVLTFFFQDSLKHKQCWMVGIRAPGSPRFYPVFVISPETARVRVGFGTGMSVSEERSGQVESLLFIQLGHVTGPHSFRNCST